MTICVNCGKETMFYQGIDFLACSNCGVKFMKIIGNCDKCHGTGVLK